MKLKTTKQLTVEFVAVGDLCLPIASLALDVETQTGRAADGGQADGTGDTGAIATDYIATIAFGGEAKVFFGWPVLAELLGCLGSFFGFVLGVTDT